MDRPYSLSDFAFPTRWDRDEGPDLVERPGEVHRRTGNLAEVNPERVRTQATRADWIAPARSITVGNATTPWATLKFAH